MADDRSSRSSVRLILSYVFDWVVILGMAAVGGGWNFIEPYKRPISLVDLSISFPFKTHETVPFWVCVIVGMVAPAVIILIVSLFFVPGATAESRQSKQRVWRRRLWEWNTGWMGLGLSLATAFLITQGLKNLTGKARPDLLSRCQPDLENFERYVVGNGYGQTVDVRWVRVSAAICQNKDTSMLDDGFRSWPSGHSSFAWSGLLYLTLFLCSKFAIAIPFLAPQSPSTSTNPHSPTLPLYKSRPEPPVTAPTHSPDTSQTLSDPTASASIPGPSPIPFRNSAAAPPNFLLVLALIPVGGAAYIAASRYTDFRHHGIDVVTGSVIGIVCAYFAFRWYHLPIRRGAGWAWGARSRERAFGIGIGVGSYVGEEGWGSRRRKGRGKGKGKGKMGEAREAEGDTSARASELSEDVEMASH